MFEIFDDGSESIAEMEILVAHSVIFRWVIISRGH